VIRLHPPIGEHDHLQGELSAPIKLVEFGDFQCSFCGRAAPSVRALQQELGDQMVFAFRHFPLEQHRYALLAAVAAEAAAAQGHFWEMHDLLFLHQDDLELEALERYAQRLGLDMRQFQDDLRHMHHLSAIRSGVESGAASGVDGTPSFFLNGRRYRGSSDYDSLYQAVIGEAGLGLNV
jgi:protein-disulfide isomerase